MIKKLDGKLSLGRCQTNSGEHIIRIELVDTISNLRIAEITLTPDIFGKVITGLSYQDVNVGLNTSSNIGRKSENKSVSIELLGDLPYNNCEFTEYMRPLVAPFEVDGWKADIYDLKSVNMHHYNIVNGKRYYRVSFGRYVDV